MGHPSAGCQLDASPVRCAVYTRKSTEEGLQQEFNSLDAQREAAEAYINSQRHEGWTCVENRYDDAGFSGATLDRPALRRLLADIEAGRIDCVVVYKVDRLSRSLLDFARLVEVFDRHKVAFVSITQQFQTTTSMGRLTLNVLLSFAQFEREMISERTRDKMGAARRKGRWVGGSPILGYDIDPGGGRILVNHAEADQVRAIFRLYLELQSLDRVLGELDRRGWTTKLWKSKRSGTERGGHRFSTCTLSYLLRHPGYVGKVRYRGGLYDGAHEAIVEKAVFEEVQAHLKEPAPSRRWYRTRPALLQGLLQCVCTAPMTPTHVARKAGWRFYYACARAEREGRASCPTPWVLRRRVEKTVVDRLREFAQASGMEEPRHVSEIRAACASLSSRWDGLPTDDRPAALQQLIRRVTFDACVGTLQIVLALPCAAPDDRAQEVTLVAPLRLQGVGGREQPKSEEARQGIARISRLVALAHHFEDLLEQGLAKDYSDIARLGHVTRPRITQVMNLLYLAPDIQEQLLFLLPPRRGRARITESSVRAIAQEQDWDKQRQLFALTASPLGRSCR